MFNKAEFLEFLKEEFPEGNLVSGGNEFRCRCRLCGDSSSNLYKARFYISLNDPSGLIFYHCFNCGAGGLFTSKVLRMISTAPSNLLMDLASLNKNHEIGLKYRKQTKIYEIQYEDIIDDDINRVKLKYFNDRLGLKLTYQDLIQNKIVLSIINLLNKNHITIGEEDVVRELDTFFIGSLSINNCLINFRQIGKESIIKDKHVKFPLFNNNDIKRYYAIPTTCNLNKRVRVNIAEGMFDINSIFFNLRGRNRENELYIAAGSKAYESVIKMCLLEFGLLNCEFHLYMDNDVEDSIVRKIQRVYKKLYIPIYVHHNQYMNEKDYGVDKSHIIDSEYELVKEN